MDKIEITFSDDLVGCAFYEGEKIIVWDEMSRQDKIHAVNAFARFYELFYPSVKED
jgi:ABC-type ATPase with predicted acetyltransferase domain